MRGKCAARGEAKEAQAKGARQEGTPKLNALPGTVPPERSLAAARSAGYLALVRGARARLVLDAREPKLRAVDVRASVLLRLLPVLVHRVD